MTTHGHKLIKQLACHPCRPIGTTPQDHLNEVWAHFEWTDANTTDSKHLDLEILGSLDPEHPGFLMVMGTGLTARKLFFCFYVCLLLDTTFKKPALSTKYYQYRTQHARVHVEQLYSET